MPRPIIALIVALILALLPSTPRMASAAAPFPISGESTRFRRINTEHGLANSRVLSILQDRRGFMWFGTGEGLNRYDGYDFTLYQYDAANPNTLSNNVVWVLFEDRAGYLWMGTDDGLTRFDPTTESFTRYLHVPSDPHSLSGSSVVSIYEDRQGTLWVGTVTGGLNRFDRARETFTHYLHDPLDPQSLSGNEVRGIVEDNSGTLWIGAFDGGLNQLVPGKSPNDPPTFRRFQYDMADPHSLSNNAIQAMTLDPNGALWIGTWGGGVNRFEPATEAFVHYQTQPDDADSLSHNTVAAIRADSTGGVWVGTFGGGLNFIDRAGHITRYRNDLAAPSSLSHDSVRSLFISRDDLLYAGTAGGGLNVLDLVSSPFSTLVARPNDPNSLSQNDVRSILEDRAGLLWIGTQSAGLNAYDPRTGRVTHYRHDPNDPASLSNDTVWALYEDREGDLWVGTAAGLDKLDHASGRFAHYLAASLIYSLFEDSAGNLWVGAYRGLFQYIRQTKAFAQYLNDPDDPASLGNNTITSFHEDSGGFLWIGTFGGLNRLDPSTGIFTRYIHDPDIPTTLSSNTVTDIYGDPSGILWLGTYGGLNRFDPRSGQTLHYTMQDGLPSNAIWKILPDAQGNLWLSTNHGLVRFDPRTQAVRTFDVEDGLISPVFNAFAAETSSSGALLFGSAGGLVALSPAAVPEQRPVGPLVFTDFQLANRPVPIGDESVLLQPINQTDALTLPHSERVISFAFAALDFRAPNRIRYRYALQGFDTTWTVVDGKRRHVTYTNLAPGNYVFEVQSADRNGDWIKPGRTVSISIVPPWWQTLWFRLAFVALLASLGAGAYRFRISMLQQRNRELEEMVSRRTTTLRMVNTEMEQHITQLSTINHIAHLLNRTGSLEAMLEQMAVITTDLFDAAGVAICLYSADHSELTIFDYHQAAASATSHASPHENGFQLTTASLPAAQDISLAKLFGDGRPLIFGGANPTRTPPSFWRHSKSMDFAHLLLAPIYIRGNVTGMIAVARDDPEQEFLPTEATLAETVAHQVAGALDNRHLFEEEKRQRRVSEQHSHELSTLLTISQELSSMVELEPMLDLIMHSVAQVLDFSTLILLALEGEVLFILDQRGDLPSDLTADEEFPAQWLGEETTLFTTRAPLIVEDLADDPRIHEVMRKTFAPKMTCLLGETRACMIVPMVTADRVVGFLWIGHREPDRYSEEQAEYITALAHQSAIAIENTYHYQTMQESAADQERNRLAQELHDSVSQTLLSATMVAESVPAIWEQSPARGRAALRQLRTILRNSLSEMRTLMLELRPSILAQKPLSEIIRQLVDSFAGRSQLPVQVFMDGDAILPAVHQVAFYRIAQGSLANILQHARASQVTVELKCSPENVELQITDNGVGFDPAATSPDRMGLTIMRDRAQKIGATFEVESVRGQGTRLTVRYTYPIGQSNGSKS